MNEPFAQGPQHAGPRPRRRIGTVLGLTVVGAAVVAVGIAGRLAAQSDPDAAAVGDCVAVGPGTDVRTVECADPAGSHRVVGKVPGKTRIQFDVSSRSICDPFPGAASAYWKGEPGGQGYVLCLAPLE